MNIENKCNLCGSLNISDVKNYNSIGDLEYGCKLVNCNSCRHYFTYFSKKLELEEVYRSGKYKVIDIRRSIFDKLVSLNSRNILWELHRLIDGGKLLDFGCGKGQFLNQADKKGWNVIGIETERERAEFGKEAYGLNISNSEYKSGRLRSSPFNAITLFQVLEHLRSPKQLLKELIDNNLSEEGYIVIEVPLFDSIQSKISRNKWLHLDPPVHYSHFTRETLLKLLKGVGVEVHKERYFSIQLGILGMVDAIMKSFGYKKNIIYELKFNKTIPLLITTITVLPIAIIIELLSVLFKKGGVIRIYGRKINYEKDIT